MKRIVWGIIIIAVAVVLLLNGMDVTLGVIGDIPVLTLIGLAVLTAVFCCLVIDKAWEILPFVAAGAFVLLEPQIAGWMGREGTNIISNWLVFGCAALIAVGIAFLNRPLKKKGKAIKNANTNGGAMKSGCGALFMGEETKIINCANFTEFKYSVTMGEGRIIFENTEAYAGDGVIDVTVKMGDAEIVVPQNWNISCDVKCEGGSVDYPDIMTVGGPLLTIVGNVRMGNLSVIRHDA